MEDEPVENISENEYNVRRRINKQVKKEKPRRATTKYDELSTPPKRILLDTYQNHAHLFPKEKLEKMQRILQESFAMSPEETEKYFEQVKTEENEIAKHKVKKIMLKRMYQKQQRIKQERKAYKFIEKKLKQIMMQLFDKPPPPLASARLKYLTDIILQQICNIRNIELSDIDLSNKTGSFLAWLANWTAIVVEQVYYAAELKKNEELAMIEAQINQEKGFKQGKKKEVESKAEMELGEEGDYLYEPDME